MGIQGEVPAPPPRRDGAKEYNWRKQLPVPARLAMVFAWATLLGCLVLTAVSWHGARQDIERETRERFSSRAEDINAAIMARMLAQEQVLRGARGLFQASSHVTRQEWRLYVESLQLAKTYPGILGIGFARHLWPEEVEGHVREVRSEGFTDYDVFPAGDRPEYTAIAYLEPFDWRNRRAFGFDMFTDPTRRQAMEEARDTGQPALTGKVTLVQETSRDVQAGFLMYLPVYRHALPTNDPLQRRVALLGYVYSPLRIKDLMAGILGSSLPDVALSIYDGAEATPSSLMYDSEAGEPAGAPFPDLVDTRLLAVAGHAWTVEVSALPGFLDSTSYQRPRLILQMGTVISLLMFLVVWSLATLQRRATFLAKDMTAALRESREQFRATAETANEAIISTDQDGMITFFNRAAECYFGYGRDEVLGRSFALLVPERLRRDRLLDPDRFLSTGDSDVLGRTITFDALRKDGSEFPVEVSIADWSTGDGVFFTAIVRDITERVEAERKIGRLNAELQRQVSQLAEANRELESFSYSVSHDLRAPLRAINGFARILKEEHDGKLPPEGGRLLGIIHDSSIRMGQLIDDLLAFSRLGQTPITAADVDMARLVREVIDELCEAGDCGPERFTIGELHAARGDRALLRQVWVNLVSNAVKFSRPRPEPRVEIGCEVADGECRYFVRDNGVGFDSARAGQLFGVFKRLHKAEQFPGTGVGLAIVQRIVAKHGGRVWAESQIDHGAVFHFVLPRGDGQEDPAP